MSPLPVLNVGVSIGGVLVGLGILLWHVQRWYHTQKGSWKDLLIPFLPFWLFGNLLGVSAGGLLGWVTGITIWGSSKVGDLSLVYGVGGTTGSASRAVSLGLTPGGHLVMGLCVVSLACFWTYKRGTPKRTALLPMASGACLALSAGWAGLVAMAIGPAVNTFGASLLSI